MNFSKKVSVSLRKELSIASDSVENFTTNCNLVLSLKNDNYLQIMSYSNGKEYLLSLAVDYLSFQYILQFQSVELVEFDNADQGILEFLSENKIQYVLSDDKAHIKVAALDVENIREPQYIRECDCLWHLVLDIRPAFNVEHIISALKKIYYIDPLSLTDTEKIILIIQRRGQGIFRKKLIEHWKVCAVTGFDVSSLLIASHIKPWNVSNNQERLDLYNGLLLSPNLDKAFDAGLITFTDEGNITISSKFENYDLLGINENMNIKKILEKHKSYLSYHREYIYKT